MVTDNHYRWDFIQLADDPKPTPATSQKVTNGSTLYTSDDSKLYVWYENQWYEKVAQGGGGTSNFNQLTNRPKYNGTTMTGDTNIPEVKAYTAGSNVSISADNEISATDTTYTAGANVNISAENVISATDTTYSDFTGTDGTAAGTAGLVPAPATTDAGKFLKADGTWGTAGGGSGVIELTSADYDWPANNPERIAVWLLDDGVYTAPSANLAFANSVNAGYGHSFVKTHSSSNQSVIYAWNGSTSVRMYTTSSSGGLVAEKNVLTPVIDNLTSTSTVNALSANQGKVLNDKIEGRIIQNAGAPTTATVGAVGMVLEDTTNGKLYICTDATNPYVWEEVGGGGGSGIIELTSADYNYPTDNPSKVALWLLDEGVYSVGTGVFAASSTGNSIEWGAGLFIVGKPFVSGNNTYVQIDCVGYNRQTGKWTHFSEETRSDNGASGLIGIFTPPTVTQTTGTSTTDVMSQNAVTSMVYADPSVKYRVQIGASSNASGNYSAALGYQANANANNSVAIGHTADVNSNQSAVALGYGAKVTRNGEVNIGTGFAQGSGYNSSDYRVLGGLYDGQSAHDAATVGQITPTTDSSAPTASTAGRLGEIRIDTTDNSAYMCVVSDSTTPAYEWKKITA